MGPQRMTWIKSLSIVVLVLGVFVCATSTAMAEYEFITREIGREVVYFEPVDIEGDGIWELALQVDGDSVGVYSPLLRRWIDGPHYLEFEGNNWGCGDFDDDGAIDYLRLLGQEVYWTTPILGHDELILTVDYEPNSLQVWGHSAESEPTFLLFTSEEETSSSCYDEGGITYCSFYGTEEGITYRYSALTGNSIESFPGWRNKDKIRFTGGSSPLAYSCHLTHYHEYQDYSGIGSFQDFDTELQILADDCGLVKSITFPTFEPCDFIWAWVDIFNIYLDYVDLGGRGSTEEIDMYWFSSMYDPPACSPDLKQLLGGYLPLSANQLWYSMTYLDFAGMAYFDLDEDGASELILPLPDNIGWERREPSTGVVIDTIMGMPSVDLRTAPIMEPDYLDLYYFEGSQLFVLNRPNMPTGVFEETGDEQVPTAFSLRQNYPNPFNSSTQVEFEIRTPGPAGFEIFDLLGRRVYFQKFDHLNPGMHSITWDAVSENGKALPSGLYFYRLSSGGMSDFRKMVLLK